MSLKRKLLEKIFTVKFSPFKRSTPNYPTYKVNVYVFGFKVLEKYFSELMMFDTAGISEDDTVESAKLTVRHS